MAWGKAVFIPRCSSAQRSVASETGEIYTTVQKFGIRTILKEFLMLIKPAFI